MNLLSRSLVLSLIFTFSSVTSANVFAGTLKEDVLRNVVDLSIDGQCVGSGICVRHEGRFVVLTAAHVAEAAVEAKVPQLELVIDQVNGLILKIMDSAPRTFLCTWRDGTTAEASVIGKNGNWFTTGLDLAVLMPENATEAFKKGWGSKLVDIKAELEEGEDVWFCGSGGAIPFMLEKTILNKQDGRFLTVNGIGWYGHSGSGVFVKRGGEYVLVGIIVHFIQHPDQWAKSPLQAERKIHEYLHSVLKK